MRIGQSQLRDERGFLSSSTSIHLYFFFLLLFLWTSHQTSRVTGRKKRAVDINPICWHTTAHMCSTTRQISYRLYMKDDDDTRVVEKNKKRRAVAVYLPTFSHTVEKKCALFTTNTQLELD